MKKGSTLTAILDNAVEKFSDRVAIKNQLTGEKWTYPELRENAFKVSNALLKCRVGKGNYVAIISDNTPNFVFGDYGILYTGATSVPIDQNLKPENLLEDYLELAKPKVILAESKYIDKIQKQNQRNIPLISLEEALKEKPVRTNVEIGEEDISTIIFSSGTSAESERAFKASMLSHGNIASNVFMAEFLTSRAEKIDGVGQGVYMEGIAKQWHSFVYMVQKAFLHAGGLLHFINIWGFKSGDGAKINPHYMLMIPNMANLIMRDVKKEIRNKGDRAYSTFEWFLKNSNELHYNYLNEAKLSIKGWLINSFAEKIFYKKIREQLNKKFGENKLYFIGGSAPLPLETQLFFYSIGLPIYQGYGLTETAPANSVNTPENYRFGSSGKPLSGVEIKIADTELLKNHELKEVAKDREGTIMVKGKNVFKGYLNEPKRTEKTFVEGWFNTEDLGFLKDGFLYVTGREKRLICTLNGEKIAAEPVETYYSAKGINLVVVGHKQEKVGALIIADEEIIDDIRKGKSREKEILEGLCKKRLNDAKEKFGVRFDSQNTSLVFDVPDILYTGVMKLRFSLFEKHYAEKIKKICNVK